MKVIDLLNKIANGEEVPKKIRWEAIIYVYSKYDKDYLEPISVDEYKGLFNMKDSILTQYLNDEVEIIEDIPKEDKKIEKLIIDKDNTGDEMFNVSCFEKLPFIRPKITDNQKVIINKINEIIDNINGGNND